MKSVLVLIAVVAAVSFASAVRVAGREGMSRPMTDPGRDFRFQIADCRLRNGDWEDTTVIAYDDGNPTTFWCSDRDSFGAAVRFTPASYPCQVVGSRAVINYDDGQQIYLRLYDDDGTGGKPGTVLYNQLRLDVPHKRVPEFKDYDLTAAVTVTSGDFYVCWWQKNIWDMQFATDNSFDSVSRQLWYFPDLGWVTPMGMDAADQLIRAWVLYSSGVVAEGSGAQWFGFKLSPNLARGSAKVNCILPGSASGTVAVRDIAGRVVLQSTICNLKSAMALDLRGLRPGVYVVSLTAATFTATEKLVVQP